jgi:hypothetical protein
VDYHQNIKSEDLSMAIPWLTVLKAVPWADVVKAAPAVREGAEKLWDGIRKKSPSNAPSTETLATVTLSPTEQVLAEHEKAIARLDFEIEQSAQVIKALAEQNANLIVRIERLQKRFAFAVAVVAVIAVAGLFFAFSRS